jgi:hypothetical protein
MVASVAIKLLLAIMFHRVRRRTESQSYTAEYEHQHTKREGDVFVSAPMEKGKVVEKDMGEYVEFETVKEDK